MRRRSLEIQKNMRRSSAAFAKGQSVLWPDSSTEFHILYRIAGGPVTTSAQIYDGLRPRGADPRADPPGFAAPPPEGFPPDGFPPQGFPDVGFPDAGFADAGFADAGLPDVGLPKAGFLAAGLPDVALSAQGLPERSVRSARSPDGSVLVVNARPAPGLAPDLTVEPAALPDPERPDPTLRCTDRLGVPGVGSASGASIPNWSRNTRGRISSTAPGFS
jgi:hypothetical protein